MSESTTGPGLDLDKNEDPAILADNINFAAFPPIISADNLKTSGL
jgi:hypothetical protein